MLHALLIAAVAAGAMVITDVLATLETLAQTRNHAHAAGLLDAATWIVSITTSTIAIDALGGPLTTHLFKKLAVVVLVTIANYIGTVWGENLGQKWFKTSTDRAIANAARSGR